jgi:hypothetical protein
MRENSIPVTLPIMIVKLTFLLEKYCNKMLKRKFVGRVGNAYAKEGHPLLNYLLVVIVVFFNEQYFLMYLPASLFFSSFLFSVNYSIFRRIIVYFFLLQNHLFVV